VTVACTESRLSELNKCKTGISVGSRRPYLNCDTDEESNTKYLHNL
jgi:hypothetical protein